MSWLGLLLVGVALTDLAFSIRPRAWFPQLTEYFLVGSFASWLVALAGLVLLAH